MGEKGVKLFGVRIMDGVRWKEEEAESRDLKGENMEQMMKKGMLKSKSMGNLVASGSTSSGDHGAGDHGYLSDGGLPKSSRRREGQERKRGVPWSEDEHRTFLAGLEKLGRGDWRGISKSFVLTRTPTQVASHAQKYFLRQTNPNKKKRRTSLFDVVTSGNARNSETPPTSPLMKLNEISEETDHLCRNHHLAGSPSFNFLQALSPGAENSSSSLNLPKTNSMVQFTPIATEDQPAATSPKLTVFNSASTANNDLELTIAPPQSNMATLSPGTIRVI